MYDYDTDSESSKCESTCPSSNDESSAMTPELPMENYDCIDFYVGQKGDVSEGMPSLTSSESTVVEVDDDDELKSRSEFEFEFEIELKDLDETFTMCDTMDFTFCDLLVISTKHKEDDTEGHRYVWHP